jgi:HSP20 family protein
MPVTTTGDRPASRTVIFFSQLPVNSEENAPMLPAILNGTASANRLSNLFERFINEEPLFAPQAVTRWAGPPVSMWQDEQSVCIELDTPGVAEADIDVSLHDGELVVSGERKAERKGVGFDNRPYGRFEQRFQLPCAVDAEKVSAKLVNGVLSLTCPKSEAAKPRKISIKSE